MPDIVPDQPPQNFECSLALLQQIVHELEDGSLGLEASLARFEEGVRLLRSCHQILEQAEQRIEILTGVDTAGNPRLEPFDATATFDRSDARPAKPGRRRAGAKNDSPTPGQATAAEFPEDDQRLF